MNSDLPARPQMKGEEMNNGKFKIENVRNPEMWIKGDSVDIQP